MFVDVLEPTVFVELTDRDGVCVELVWPGCRKGGWGHVSRELLPFDDVYGAALFFGRHRVRSSVCSTSCIKLLSDSSTSFISKNVEMVNIPTVLLHSFFIVMNEHANRFLQECFGRFFFGRVLARHFLRTWERKAHVGGAIIWLAKWGSVFP